MRRSESFPLVGLLHFATDTSLPLLELARAAAERGFDSIVLGEHTHVPVSRETPFPGGREMPDRYRRMIDPYVGLAVVAAQTNLMIGTCVSLVAEHDPISLAKTAATLDFLSEGRFTLGVGFGWNREELADHGHKFTERRAVVREYVALMRTLWREEEAEFRGDHASLSRSWAWPKPVQQPSIPVLIGCNPTQRGYEEIIRWADGWIPRGNEADQLAVSLKTLRAQWLAAGRDASGPVIWAMQNSVPDDEELSRQLDHFQRLGVKQVILDLQTAPRDEVLGVLDRYAKVLAKSFG